MSEVRPYRPHANPIQAIQYTGKNYSDVRAFVGNTYRTDEEPEVWASGFVALHSVNGYKALLYDSLTDDWIRVEEGDMVVRLHSGTFFSCSEEDFAEVFLDL